MIPLRGEVGCCGGGGRGRGGGGGGCCDAGSVRDGGGGGGGSGAAMHSTATRTTHTAHGTRHTGRGAQHAAQAMRYGTAWHRTAYLGTTPSRITQRQCMVHGARCMMCACARGHN